MLHGVRLQWLDTGQSNKMSWNQYLCIRYYDTKPNDSTPMEIKTGMVNLIEIRSIKRSCACLTPPNLLENLSYLTHLQQKTSRIKIGMRTWVTIRPHRINIQGHHQPASSVLASALQPLITTPPQLQHHVSHLMAFLWCGDRNHNDNK